MLPDTHFGVDSWTYWQTAEELYFEHLAGEKGPKELGIDIDQWVKDTDKFSVAHLKELFIAVIILGDPYDEAIEALTTMKDPIDDRDNVTDMGFRVSESKDIYN